LSKLFGKGGQGLAERAGSAFAGTGPGIAAGKGLERLAGSLPSVIGKRMPTDPASLIRGPMRGLGEVGAMGGAMVGTEALLGGIMGGHDGEALADRTGSLSHLQAASTGPLPRLMQEKAALKKLNDEEALRQTLEDYLHPTEINDVLSRVI
jgi:hypothetical protein